MAQQEGSLQPHEHICKSAALNGEQRLFEEKFEYPWIVQGNVSGLHTARSCLPTPPECDARQLIKLHWVQFTLYKMLTPCCSGDCISLLRFNCSFHSRRRHDLQPYVGCVKVNLAIWKREDSKFNHIRWSVNHWSPELQSLKTVKQSNLAIDSGLQRTL